MDLMLKRHQKLLLYCSNIVSGSTFLYGYRKIFGAILACLPAYSVTNPCYNLPILLEFARRRGYCAEDRGQ